MVTDSQVRKLMKAEQRRENRQIGQLEACGRTDAGVSGAVSAETAPAADESGKERRGSSLEPQVPGLQCDDPPEAEAEGVLSLNQ